MPTGYLVTMVVVALCVAFALAPPHPRRSRPWRLSFLLGNLVNELPFLTCFWLTGATVLVAAEGELATPIGFVGLGLAAASSIGLILVVRRATRTRAALDVALTAGLGAAAVPTERDDRRLAARRLRIIAWPFPWWIRPGVTRVADIAYGPDGRHHRLDVSRPRRGPAAGPILVHLHGGAFRVGHKSLDGEPLVTRLARHGWICISANYRTGPDVVFPEHLIDVKRVIAWAKAHAADHGADPEKVFVAGTSAGGHLAVTAALTAGDARFQPGFETTDTAVVAAISLSGYYGRIATNGPPSSPHDYLAADAPPVAIVHGDQDTVVIVEDARSFAHDLAAHTRNPVVYAELHGAQHGFDMFHSIRSEAVVDAVVTFAAAVTARVAWGRG